MSEPIVEDFDESVPEDLGPPPEGMAGAYPIRYDAKSKTVTFVKSDSNPHSAEAEEHLLACCMLDEGYTLDHATERGVTEGSFYFPENRLTFHHLTELRRAKEPVSLETLMMRLIEKKELDQAGGPTRLMEIEKQATTTAHASHMIDKVVEKSTRRELIKQANILIEQSRNGVPLDDLLVQAQQALKGVAPKQKRHPQKDWDQFQIQPASDASVLLGNRYLNRGDGIILSGSSGMGKSSMQTQMAVSWACGRDFHGIKPNGPQKSLIIQSEDSDGDIAEVIASMRHMMKLTEAEISLIKANVRFVTDRINRGTRFMAALKAHVEEFKPDLVWLNPLQAFIDGDVTESRDLGFFLREGLNGLNVACEFGYIIVHHTTKPATGKDKQERLWHEVMYDMAGGAELINWARGIISLRASDIEGEFKLVLAKRGRRAGVVKEVEQGAGVRFEPVTQIGLRHAHGLIPGTKVPIIYWEPCTITEIPASEKKGTGRPEKYSFNDFRSLFPAKSSPGMPLKYLHQHLVQNSDIKQPTLFNCLKRWAEDGNVEIIEAQGQPTRYRANL